MRLSQEDEKDGLSASIVSQRNILKEYIRNNENLLVYEQIEFIDDGYSGYNFNRPAMSNLIEMVRGGEIDYILVKDISRFGRNQLEVLPYIEKIFPFMNVTFISVIDRYDTSKKIDTNTAMDISIKSMIHEFYLKDLSKKMKSSNKIMAKKGKNTASTKTFGYVKDKNNKHKIVIDEEAAEIVRMIFDYAYKGMSISEIASMLNKNNIETPLKYWQRKDINNNVVGKFRKSIPNPSVDNFEEQVFSNYWTYFSVSRTLKNEVYIGTFVGYKREIIGIKSNKSIKKDEDEWIKVKNTHEAIVEDTIFFSVQEKLFSKKNSRKEYAKPHIFARKIYCGYCGMSMKVSSRKKNSFQCCSKRYSEEENCFAKPIPKNYVESKVFETLKELAKVKLQGEASKVGKNNVTLNDVTKSLERRNIKELDKLNLQAKKLFEKYINGKVTKEYFEVESYRINEQKNTFEIEMNFKETNLRLNTPVDEILFSGEIDILNAEVKEKDLLTRILESEVFFDDMVKFVKKVVVYGEDKIEVELNMV